MKKQKIKKPLSRSEIMSRVKGKDTSIEVLLRKALWQKGLRYRKNVRKIYGTPDIAFIGLKIAIFCDSEFWHGKQYLDKGSLPTKNQEFWREKLERNIERDKEVNNYLVHEGWTVLRFWEKDIRSNLLDITDEIVTLVTNKKNFQYSK